MIGTRRKWFLLYLSAAWFLCAGVSWPATLATLRGSVSDSLSQPIGNAKVTLFLDGAERSVTQTDSQGQFAFKDLSANPVAAPR